MAERRIASCRACKSARSSRREPPFDLRITGKRTGAGARHVREDAIEPCREGEITRIGGDHADIAGFRPRVVNLARSAVFEEDVRGEDGDRPRQLRLGIPIGDGQSLSAWSRATVENPCAVADKSCDELRGFVLNNAKARSESGSPGDISVLHSSCGGQEQRREQVRFLRR